MPGAPFDVVLIDPPYALGTSPAENLVSALASRGLLAHGAIALFERISSTPALVLEASTLFGKSATARPVSTS